MDNDFQNITGVVLAGGRARRMGGEDKGLLKVSGKAMIEYMIAALQTQVKNTVISANRNLSIYSRYGFPVIADSGDGFDGPLAGMASCMQAINTEYLITVPCDSPLLPEDYVMRMLTALEVDNADIGVADSGKRIQPVFSLLKCSLLESLMAYLNSGERKIDRWFQQHTMTRVDFSDKPETFINVNTPEDIRDMETELTRISSQGTT